MCQRSHITPTAHIPYHHRGSTRLNSPLLTNRMYYPIWVIDVVSVLVHVHPSDTIGNETRQTRQRVSNHQQPNGSVVGPRRVVKHCTVQSTTVNEWAFGSESPY
ncbi:hypothetical protein AVEN_169807-1 [Araneus ventricosus]|uniref:Uncharacterized protein n=1 Tax=Araneus ventricosus TaxID=182803 RepID=A0A4Y2PAA5_ARAVE|nr:hypothetical protein AVEN_169807-1 [Araneus ventricosus]